MSLISDFIAAVAPAAMEAIGTETIAIGGGTAIAAVLNESTHARDYMGDGFAPQTALSATVQRSVWSAAYSSAASSYVGKTAVARSVTYRVESVEVGANFVMISLSQKEKA